METNQERYERPIKKTRSGRLDLQEDCDPFLQEKMAELNNIREELKEARDSATQSWLDSQPIIDELEKLQAGLASAKRPDRCKAISLQGQSWLDSQPIIDELEKLQAGLASAKNQASMSNVVISELESELERTNSAIKSNIVEEAKEKERASEVNREVDLLRMELEAIKQETGEDRRERWRLKQTLRMKRQTLRTLQLSIRAIRIEKDACDASAEEAFVHIDNSETDSGSVLISEEEYVALKRRAKKEKSLAEWRVSMAAEQKHAAEASRNLLKSRLKGATDKSARRRRRVIQEKIVEDDEQEFKEVEEQNLEVVEKNHETRMGHPKARAEAIGKLNQGKQKNQPIGKSSSDRNRRLQKKIGSLLQRIRQFFKKRIWKFFW